MIRFQASTLGTLTIIAANDQGMRDCGVSLQCVGLNGRWIDTYRVCPAPANPRPMLVMQRNSLETVSVWQETTPSLPAGRLAREECDVCIIGAGIAGLTAAYLLQQEGRDVQVLEAFDIGAGETGRTTAHLTAVLDDRFFELEKLFGSEKARLAAQSHAAAIDTIERIVREAAIDCDFERVDGVLFCSKPDQAGMLDREARSALSAGFADMVAIDSLAMPNVRFDGPALRFPRQAMFHIGKYLQGLARAFVKRGGLIATATKAVAVEVGEIARVMLEGGREIRARQVVVATNTPFVDRVKMHTKQAAYRTYVVGFTVAPGAFAPVLLWDLEDPYHYIRLVRDIHGGEVLIIGGEDHKTGQAENPGHAFATLVEWAREHFSGLGELKYRWSGQVMEPIDGLAYIGRNPGDENIYVVTGDSGNGMTHGTLGGMITADLIAGRENPWSALDDPARKTLRAAGSFIDENANVLGHLVKDWVGRGDVKDRSTIPLGSGAIVREGVNLLAIYRDHDGTFHELSAACTHLGCAVQWNGVESSWDCPCHGSRFAPDGVVLNGPAARPLKRHDDDVDQTSPARSAEVHRGITPSRPE
jgi:glycine/D-amino acid oxidase-like deaminating enzyme/nitrite reductase/ring-hydroxylating ferredoxin subunit